MKNKSLKIGKFGFFLIFLTTALPLLAETEKPSYSKSIDIKTMLQGLTEPLPVEAAIPDDFSFSSKSSHPNIDEGIFWGKKRNPRSLLRR